jgi:putative peptidoglycan lipid II flippase
VRALVADAALSSAFVPVFTELHEQRRRREAALLAGSLFGLILLALGTITLLFIALAGVIIPPLTGDAFSSQLDDLTVGLTRLMFPIVVLLGLNGLVVGMLNSMNRFTVPALTPLVWNLVIIACLVGLTPLFTGDDRLYAYAIGILAGTVVQFVMVLPGLRKAGLYIPVNFSFRDPRIARVLKLMIPVTLSLGLINIDLVLNTVLGSLVSDEAPRAIDAAFRIYMLPQGIFSVAVATVLFPSLSRLAARGDLAGLRHVAASGTRQIALTLIPAAVAMGLLAEPITRLVFERGAFDAGSTERTQEALAVFAISLPFAGINLLLTRAFFALQRPWVPTSLAAASLVVNAGVSLLFYESLGIAGIVLGTAVGSVVMTLAQVAMLRRETGGFELARTLGAVARISLAAAALGAISYGLWSVLDDLLGRSLVAQAISLGTGLSVGIAVYAALVWIMRVDEARLVADVLTRRLRRGRS